MKNDYLKNKVIDELFIKKEYTFADKDLIASVVRDTIDYIENCLIAKTKRSRQK